MSKKKVTKKEAEKVFRYHGKQAGLTAYQIPGRDLTKDDLARLSHIGISEEDVVATKLYRRVGKGSKNKGKASDVPTEEFVTITKE